MRSGGSASACRERSNRYRLGFRGVPGRVGLKALGGGNGPRGAADCSSVVGDSATSAAGSDAGEGSADAASGGTAERSEAKMSRPAEV